MKRSTTLLAAGAALALAAGLAGPAAAGGSHGSPGRPGAPTTITDGLLTPLKLAVDRDGTSFVSQNFAGLLTRVSRSGAKTDLFNSGGDEVGSVSRKGRTTFFTTTGMDENNPSAKLWALRDGSTTPRLVADLFAHEQRKNPDRRTTYGFRNLRDPSCLAQFPADQPATYTGIVESHPYSTLPADGGLFVADAAANAILWVSHRGKVETVAAMPAAKPVVATAEILAAQGLPACAAGQKYWFEPVPTDIEESHDGKFYVTSLPGGPEDASLGARGALFQLKPWKGELKRVADGFVGAVDVATGPQGQLAVAELFGGAQGQGQVTLLTPRKRHHGWTRSTLPLTAPAAVEWLPGRHGSSTLYATTDAFGPQGPAPTGKIVKVAFSGERKGHHHRRGSHH